jgi:hypothetical protein
VFCNSVELQEGFIDEFFGVSDKKVNGGILLVNFRCPDKQNCVGHHVFE